MSSGSRYGIVREDLIAGRARRQEVEDILHADSDAANAGAPSAHGWIDRNPINRAHLTSPMSLLTSLNSSA